MSAPAALDVIAGPVSWVAAFPMYELDATRAPTDALWTGLAQACRRQGIHDVPDRLSRDVAREALFAHPRLLFAQTCGYPYTHALRGRVRLIATPAYRAPGCEGASYRSFIVVREDDPAVGLAGLRGRRAAINGLDSQSGHIALRAAMAEAGLGGERPVGPAILTGSHLASIDAVRAGSADFAAIDAVSHALVARHLPDRLAGLRVLAESPAAPGLPFVAGSAVDDETLQRQRAALGEAMADPALAAARDDLLLVAVEFLPASAYGRILELERRGEAVRFDLWRGNCSPLRCL